MNLRPVKVENATGLHIGLGYGNGKKAAFLCMIELPDIGDYTTIWRIHDGEERHTGTTAARSTADKCGLLHSDS